MFKITRKIVFAGTAIVAIVAVCFATMTIAPRYFDTIPSASVAEPVAEPVAESVAEPVNIYAGLTVLTQDAEVTPVDETASIIVSSQGAGVVGELIRFDVSNSVAESFKWILVPEAADFEVYANGTRAVFSARLPGDYMFVVACAYKGTVDVTTHIVTIAGDPRVDPVDPVKPADPVDWPTIIDPGADANLIRKVPYWCAQSSQPWDEANQLAASFENVAAMIRAGVYTTPAEIIKATGSANRKALGPALQSWLPVLRQLQDEFQQMAQDGELVTVDQHAETWIEVAAALKQYVLLFMVE